MQQHNIIFATNNEHKAKEIRLVLGNAFNIQTLKDAGIFIDIPEPHDTLEANATEKSKTIFELTAQDCFSEDTGLEVDALAGQPGVKSARYAGDDANFERNIDTLLHNMDGILNRNARFRTVISLFWKGQEYQFDGICTGHITTGRQGDEGFGYDPVFVPEGAEKSFGQMTLHEKSAYSHRRKATDKLIQFLQAQHGQN